MSVNKRQNEGTPDSKDNKTTKTEDDTESDDSEGTELICETSTVRDVYESRPNIVPSLRLAKETTGDSDEPVILVVSKKQEIAGWSFLSDPSPSFKVTL